MSKKGLGILAVLVAIVAIIVISSGGSDSSSGWNSSDEIAVEDKITESAPELSSDAVECAVDAIKADYSPSEVFEGESSSANQEKLEQIFEDCSDSSSESSSADLYGGPACEEDLEGSACAEEVEAGTGEAVAEGEEALEEEQAEDQEEYENEEGIYSSP
jgi:hypothetical protein